MVKVMGFMPTLGRPELVEEVLWMWEVQSYPDRDLLVYDTGNQMPEVSGYKWHIVHQGSHPASMGTTCNTGIRMSDAPLIVRIDDDDHYFPWHVEACVEALEKRQWCCPYAVWDAQYGDIGLFCTYRKQVGPVDVAWAGAWGFRREAFESVGAYSEDRLREEECEFRDRLGAKYGVPGDTTAGKFPQPSYLYAANHKRIVHYGHCTDAERRAYQQRNWPKWDKVTPRMPKNFMCGLPMNAIVQNRRF